MGQTPRNSHKPPSSEGPENRHALEVGLSRPRLGAGSPVNDTFKLSDLVMVGTGNDHQRPPCTRYRSWAASASRLHCLRTRSCLHTDLPPRRVAGRDWVPQAVCSVRTGVRET